MRREGGRKREPLHSRLGETQEMTAGEMAVAICKITKSVTDKTANLTFGTGHTFKIIDSILSQEGLEDTKSRRIRAIQKVVETAEPGQIEQALRSLMRTFNGGIGGD